jgi:hypothetical protein
MNSSKVVVLRYRNLSWDPLWSTKDASSYNKTVGAECVADTVAETRISRGEFDEKSKEVI